jgi:hypothetical protein
MLHVLFAALLSFSSLTMLYLLSAQSISADRKRLLNMEQLILRGMEHREIQRVTHSHSASLQLWATKSPSTSLKHGCSISSNLCMVPSFLHNPPSLPISPASFVSSAYCCGPNGAQPIQRLVRNAECYFDASQYSLLPLANPVCFFPNSWHAIPTCFRRHALC